MLYIMYYIYIFRLSEADFAAVYSGVVFGWGRTHRGGTEDTNARPTDDAVLREKRFGGDLPGDGCRYRNSLPNFGKFRKLPIIEENRRIKCKQFVKLCEFYVSIQKLLRIKIEKILRKKQKNHRCVLTFGGFSAIIQ